MGNVLPFRRRLPLRRRPKRPIRRRFARPGPVPFLAAICVTCLAAGLAPIPWERAPSPGDWLRQVSLTPADQGPDGFSGRVVRVIDGDSFRMDCCGPDIRLWGIDAPEWNTRGGPAATAALRLLIAGRPLACRRRDTDRYGRIVGQCALADGGDLGRLLLQTGTVREYCYFSGNHYRTC